MKSPWTPILNSQQAFSHASPRKTRVICSNGTWNGGWVNLPRELSTRVEILIDHSLPHNLACYLSSKSLPGSRPKILLLILTPPSPLPSTPNQLSSPLGWASVVFTKRIPHPPLLRPHFELQGPENGLLCLQQFVSVFCLILIFGMIEWIPSTLSSLISEVIASYQVAQSTVPRLTVSVWLGNWLDIQILEPHPDLLNLNSADGAEQSVYTSLPGASGAHPNLRTSVIKQPIGINALNLPGNMYLC